VCGYLRITGENNHCPVQNLQTVLIRHFAKKHCKCIHI